MKLRRRGDPCHARLQALVIGALHGPAEMLPISSSGHVELVPWLLGWDGVSADPEVRKAFEVALHAGTAAGLAVTLRAEVVDAVRHASADAAAVVALSLLPPVITGLVLERPIERHLGTPASVALGLITGAAAMSWADRSAQERGLDDAEPRDGWWLGVAQACALFPGVSRNGATLTAARLRHFRRIDAEQLSRQVALPVIGGATALKCLRLLRRGLPPGASGPFALGASASFASTLASSRLSALVERDRSLAPFAIYRVVLGSLALCRAWTMRRTPSLESGASE